VKHETARVLSIDDEPRFLDLLGGILCAADHLELVGEAGSGELGLELVEALHPDMVTLDVRMPGIGGIEAARLIRQTRPSAIVVLISATHPDELPAESRAVADAVLWKSELEPRLLDEIWMHRRHRP
jgi:DNA-binding NarL/FixJ family response regulator